MRSANVICAGRNHNRSQFMFKMESTALKLCSICCTSTKYRCITRKILICNRCAIAEEDEGKEGWIAGRQVGYCSDCHDQVGQQEGPVERRATQGIAETTMEKVAAGAAAAQW